MAEAAYKKDATDTFVDPDGLHLLLEPAQTREITFRSEKAMRSYRAMIYTINKQATYRYRTIRSEGSMWAILLWRMK